MKKNNIFAVGKRKYRHTTDSDHLKPVAENLVDRKFNVSSPGMI